MVSVQWTCEQVKSILHAFKCDCDAYLRLCGSILPVGSSTCQLGCSWVLSDADSYRIEAIYCVICTTGKGGCSTLCLVCSDAWWKGPGEGGLWVDTRRVTGELYAVTCYH